IFQRFEPFVSITRHEHLLDQVCGECAPAAVTEQHALMPGERHRTGDLIETWFGHDRQRTLLRARQNCSDKRRFTLPKPNGAGYRGGRAARSSHEMVPEHVTNAISAPEER